MEMTERKPKRRPEDVPELKQTSLEPARLELGSGYTLSVRYDEHQEAIVFVKTYGRVNLGKLREEIERIFPNAQIQQEGRSQMGLEGNKDKDKLSREKKNRISPRPKIWFEK
jgi:hypothetical protein